MTGIWSTSTTAMELPSSAPEELLTLLNQISRDYPTLLGDHLVGVYVWGSLSYNAFEPEHSDVDIVVLTSQDLSDTEFVELSGWFSRALKSNDWANQLDMRFVIDGEFFDKTSKCCVFQFGKFERSGSDGNPFIWMNVKL